jgi:Uma2 family endonuclease
MEFTGMAITDENRLLDDVRLLTADEFWATYVGQPYELIRGEVREMAPAGGVHQVVVGLVTYHLNHVVLASQAGIVLAGEGGFLLHADPPTVWAADVAYIQAAHVPESGIPGGYWSRPPDLVVEVVSPNDRGADIQAKVNDYLAVSVPLIWVIYPDQRQVVVFTGATVTLLHEQDSLGGGEVLPGFEVAVGQLLPPA